MAIVHEMHEMVVEDTVTVDGYPLSGARVVATSVHEEYDTETDDDGHFRLELPHEAFDVHVESPRGSSGLSVGGTSF